MSHPDDEHYAEVGRNWDSVLRFARSLGYELDQLQFKHTVKNITISLSFDQLQGPRGVAILRAAMMGARGTKVDKK